MKHRYSLAQLAALMLPPPALVDAAAKAGYDYVGLRANRVAADEPLYALTEDANLLRETKALLPLLELAAELGAHDVIAQLPDPDRQRAIDQFGRLCDLARPLGVFANL